MNSQAPEAKLAWLDALRGAAILLVITVHAGQRALLPEPWMKIAELGQLGVQLFFVVSAITLVHSRTLSPNAPWLYFFVRRCFRLAPLYYTGIVLYTVYKAMVISRGATTAIAASLPTVKAVLLNFLLAQGFDAQAMNSVVPGGWSIGCEFIFYLAFPAIMCILGIPKSGSRRRTALGLTIAFTAICIAYSLIDLRMSSRFMSTALYYSFVSQAPVFLTGILAYPLVVSLPPSKSVLWCSIFVGIASLATLLAIWLSDSPFFLLAVPSFAGISFVCLSVILLSRWRGYEPRILILLGEVSYSIYIIHFMVLEAIAIILRLARIDYRAEFPLLFFTIFLLVGTKVSYSIGRLLHQQIEVPGIALGKKLIGRLKHREHNRTTPLEAQ